MVAKNRELQRILLLTGLMGILTLGWVIGSFTGCSPPPTSVPTTSTTTPEPVLIVSTPISCPFTYERQQTPAIYIWLVVDRSKSMPSECSDSLDALYLLPSFFIEVGKSLQLNHNITPYFAIRLIGPDEEILKPTLASEIQIQYLEPNTKFIIGESQTNEYEKALHEIGKAIITRETRRIVILLTDGTFSGQDYAEKEKQDIQEALQEIHAYEGEVYVLLCSEKNKGFWEELAGEGLLTASPYKFPEGIKEFGERLFPKEIVGNIGWFTGAPKLQIPFPREGLSVSIKLLAITDNDKDFILEQEGELKERILQLSPIENLTRGKFTLYKAVDNFPLEPVNCEAQLYSLRRVPEIVTGFYMVQSDLPVYRHFTVTTSVSINNGWANLSFSSTEGLMPSACYTFSLESDEITIKGSGQDFEWRPVSEDKGPREIPARVRLRVAGEDTFVECGKIYLPVKFAPQPPEEKKLICSTPAKENNRIREIKVGFRFVSSRPSIYFCSQEQPPNRLREHDLKCGTPYPDGNTMVCPAPELLDGEYCVRAEFTDEPPSRYHPVVVSENKLDAHKYEYTVRLYECLERYCGYDKMYFQWPESDSTVNQKIVFTKKGGCWQRGLSAR